MQKEIVSFSEIDDNDFDNELLDALAIERSAIQEIEQEKEENSLPEETASLFVSAFLYYQGKDMLDDMQKSVYRQGMAAFGGIAPTYHIELLEKPTIVWDFHSLLLAIQMMFSFMLANEKSSLKVCKHCGKVFLASRPNTVFCSGQCKNQYNVYKSRGKTKKININREEYAT